MQVGSLSFDFKNGYTVLGLLNINKNQFQGNLYEGAANSKCVIQTLGELSKKIERKTIIIQILQEYGKSSYCISFG